MKYLWRSERGDSESIGFMAMIPLVLVVLLGMLQVSMLGFTIVVAESAVRDASRAAAVGGNVDNAVIRITESTGIRMTYTTACDANSNTVRVDLWANTPGIIKALQSETIHRWAVMQVEGQCP